MRKTLASRDLFEKLNAAGLVEHDPDAIRRVVIDLQAGHVAVIYVELFADEEKLTAGIAAALTVEPPVEKQHPSPPPPPVRLSPGTLIPTLAARRAARKANP